jgi:hypothetical protein
VKALAAEIHCSGDPAGASCRGSCYAHGPVQPPPPPPPGPDPEVPKKPTWPTISGKLQQYHLGGIMITIGTTLD